MSSWSRGVVAAAILAVPSASFATTGLQWKFDGPNRYHIQVAVKLPQAIRIYAQQNLEARASAMTVAVATTCQPGVATKQGWEVSCVLDDVALRGAPLDQDLGLLLPILVEWDGMLTGSTVTFLYGRDGRVRELDLQDVETRTDDRRAAEILETMRLVMLRIFAPLDLQLPKKGDDGDRSWRQRETLILAFPSSVGALGSVIVEHQVGEVTGDLIDLSTTGHGILGAGDTVSVNGSERIANYYAFELEGTARFDRAGGRLLSRDYTATGKMTSSSVDAAGGAGRPYVQVGSLRWLIDDAPAPDLGPTGEVAP